MFISSLKRENVTVGGNLFIFETKIKLMKKLLLTMFIIVFAFYSCQNKTENHIEEQKETIQNEISKTNLNNIIFEKDSTRSSFEVSYKIITTDNKISYQYFDDNGKKETSFVEDNQVKLLIKYKNQIVLDDTIIKDRFKKFIYENLDNYQLAIFNIDEISNSSCTFFVNICVPESDNCYTFNYIIFNDGNQKIIEIDNEIED
jgi:hypothetical protein